MTLGVAVASGGGLSCCGPEGARGGAGAAGPPLGDALGEGLGDPLGEGLGDPLGEGLAAGAACAICAVEPPQLLRSRLSASAWLVLAILAAPMGVEPPAMSVKATITAMTLRTI